LKDSGYVYHKGDKYPREGYTPEPERIEELSGSENAFKAPIIAEIKKKKNKGV
jgi:hypothetical protein